jgi:hypothetical protein
MAKGTRKKRGKAKEKEGIVEEKRRKNKSKGKLS